MKYVILIHSNPQPWGHPTSAFTDEGRAVAAQQHKAMDAAFEALLGGLSDSGEFVTAEALDSPSTSTCYGWTPTGHIVTDGPFAESKEQLAGFFIVDCATRERAEEVAAQFAGPGSTVELRPTWAEDDGR